VTLVRSTSEYAQVAHSGNPSLNISSEYVQILTETPTSWTLSVGLGIPVEYNNVFPLPCGGMWVLNTRDTAWAPINDGGTWVLNARSANWVPPER
jgi:hypothetical protein